MHGRGCRVEADGDGPDSSLAELSGSGPIDQDPARSHDHPEALVRAVPGDGKDILPQERLPAGEHDHGSPGLADLVDDAERLLRGEHALSLFFPGIHVTVAAFQEAPERDVPRDETRRLVFTFQWFCPSRT